MAAYVTAMCYNFPMEKYNLLQPLSFIRTTSSQKKVWLCECDCGVLKEVILSDLKSGNTKSCGCLNLKKIRQRNREKTGVDFIVSNTKEYAVYCSAKRRCEKVNDPAYSNYGGRGIKMSMTFKEMIEAIGFRPSDKHSIDRIDVDGNYEIDNIRWATNTEQSRNTRRTNAGTGVAWRKDNKKWRAYISVNKKLIHLGCYIKKEDALKARKAGVVKYWHV